MIPIMKRIFYSIAVTAAMLFMLPACATASAPYQSVDAAQRNSTKAQRLSSEASLLVFTNPEKAASMLREALAADLYHGPAHNNLGVLYLNAGKLYEAASEFEWARKLMPGHPDPRLNLAMTLEQAGRVDDALDAYNAALEVYPDHLPTLMGLARMQIRTRTISGQTKEYLQAIVMRSSEANWKQWAEKELIRIDR